MEKKFNIENIQFKLKSTHKGEKPPAWGGKEDWNRAHCHHKVTVSTGRRWISFDYWASINDPEIREANDLLSAFHCLLMDAESAISMSTLEFCEEFGYEGESGYPVYKACQKQAEKVAKLFSEDELYALLNSETLREL
jgi:hypothetical protein